MNWGARAGKRLTRPAVACRENIASRGIAPMSSEERYKSRRAMLLSCCTALSACLVQVGCDGAAVAPPQSDAQDRLAKLMNLYRVYVEKNQKGPPNEEALREFGK